MYSGIHRKQNKWMKEQKKFTDVIWGVQKLKRNWAGQPSSSSSRPSSRSLLTKTDDDDIHRFLHIGIQIVQIPHSTLPVGKYFIIYARCMKYTFYLD